VIVSSVTMKRLRLKSGSTVCVKPLNGGELSHRDTMRGLDMSLMSRMIIPASRYAR
jgi:hypothetical protein